jgi:hypothetical protein
MPKETLVASFLEPPATRRWGAVQLSTVFEAIGLTAQVQSVQAEAVAGGPSRLRRCRPR